MFLIFLCFQLGLRPQEVLDLGLRVGQGPGQFVSLRLDAVVPSCGRGRVLWVVRKVLLVLEGVNDV